MQVQPVISRRKCVSALHKQPVETLQITLLSLPGMTFGISQICYRYQAKLSSEYSKISYALGSLGAHQIISEEFNEYEAMDENQKVYQSKWHRLLRAVDCGSAHAQETTAELCASAARGVSLCVWKISESKSALENCRLRQNSSGNSKEKSIA